MPHPLCMVMVSLQHSVCCLRSPALTPPSLCMLAHACMIAQVQIAYSQIREIRVAPRAFGAWGDMVIVLKKGERLELVGMEKFADIKVRCVSWFLYGYEPDGNTSQGMLGMRRGWPRVWVGLGERGALVGWARHGEVRGCPSR